MALDALSKLYIIRTRSRSTFVFSVTMRTLCHNSLFCRLPHKTAGMDFSVPAAGCFVF